MLMRNGKKSLKKASVLLTTFLLVVMCLAVDTTSVSAAKIKLNKTKLTLTQGKKYRLKIKGTKKKVKWSSTKKAVATVNKKGVVTAKKKGTAYIKAKVGKKTYKCKVTVKSKKAPAKPAPTTPSAPVNPPAEPTATPTAAPAKTPVLSATSLSMRKGEYYQLSVQDPKHLPVWTSSLGSTDPKKGAGAFAGLAIGLSLVLVHIVCIPITGTSVNPARSIGPALFQGGEALSQLWLFIVAPFVGAAVSALVWNYFGDKNEKK